VVLYSIMHRSTRTNSLQLQSQLASAALAQARFSLGARPALSAPAGIVGSGGSIVFDIARKLWYLCILRKKAGFGRGTIIVLNLFWLQTSEGVRFSEPGSSACCPEQAPLP